ncbi:hypothetical protein DEV91_102309 [Phyllobacterium brassicacearum]|nr:hypothetical protein DEV91_102309 [Phyllobacterium brassicacearum]
MIPEIERSVEVFPALGAVTAPGRQVSLESQIGKFVEQMALLRYAAMCQNIK